MNNKKLAFKKLARLYAAAFLNLHYDQIKDSDSQGLQKAYDFFLNHTQACFLMRLSLIDTDFVKKILQKKRKEFLLPECFDKLLCLLYAHKRTFLLSYVFQQLISEINKKRQWHHFLISHVATLSQEQKSYLNQWISRQIDGTVICQYQKDTTLIAGIRVQNEKYIWENSIRNRLNILNNSFKR